MNYRRFSLLSIALVSLPACGGMTTDADAPTDTGTLNDVPSVMDGGTDTGMAADTSMGSDASVADAGLDVGLDGGTNDAGMCMPRPTDLSALGADCASTACPTGFTCQGYSGVVFQESCAILCEVGGCPCPSGTRCDPVSDKGASWHECRYLPD
jgi:hypothetical protein